MGRINKNMKNIVQNKNSETCREDINIKNRGN